jgi:5'-3' exoribonuclease 1
MKNYVTTKLHSKFKSKPTNKNKSYSNLHRDVLREQAEEYLRGVQWVANYYYDGVASWSWFYPHHFAPYASDVAANAMRPCKGYKFAKGRPFLPFQQLLGVLPAASRTLLPKAYHPLMLMDSSPLKPFYPEDFDTDLNGKKQDWEAVVLIPFIDEGILLAAMATVESKLTPDEFNRNRHRWG